MKNPILISAALIAALASSATAQPPTRVYDQEDMMARKAELLKHDWLKQADWVMSYAKAKAQAAKSGKLIFTYFTRSYAP